jgi:glucosamine-6-phosphate deaminase
MRTWIADRLKVEVHDTHDAMAAAAATAAADWLAEVLTHQTQARVIFASAASQVRFLDQLTRQARVDWSRVVCFHMDEYLGIEPTHPASFRRFLRERVETPLRPWRFHYLMGEATEPLAECDRYAAMLQEAPMDLCILGIGENGHVAFNDPPVANFQDPRTVKLVRLDDACRRQQVGEGAFPTLAEVPPFAYTLTVPALCAARRLVCVVPEGRKAEAVRNALLGPVAEACPASVLRQQPQATLFLDTDSASLLELGL